MLTLVFLFIAAVWAGAQNALAGGGSFITLPALLLSGLDARMANITSTLALFPGQLAVGVSGLSLIGGADGLRVRTLIAVSLAGGALGALLLLATPSDLFERLLPWLILVATALFAWGSFFRPLQQAAPLGPRAAAFTQFGIAIYGGYFGGGIGFLMMAALTLAGIAVRSALATKNLLAAVMNASAVAIFLFVPGVDWTRVGVVGAGSLVGGMLGGWAVHRVNERALRLVVVVLGAGLTVLLFLRQFGLLAWYHQAL